MLRNLNIRICWQTGAIEENRSFPLQRSLHPYAARQIFTDAIKTDMTVTEV